ncbi:MAG: ABC transporter permease [Streptosporangiales bacterium]|nr:ABC transporter permease [Streptosporangiales bacterium]
MAVWACSIGVGVVFLLAWELASRDALINTVFFSKPTDIVARLWQDLLGAEIYGRTIYEQIWITTQSVLIGYVVGGVGGTLVGFAVGRSKWLCRALEPYILTFYAIPKISIAPLFILVFGIGLQSKVAIVAMESFFILFTSTLRGVVEIDEELVQAARIMGAPRRTVFGRILVPASLPAIFSGLQLAVPFAVIGAVLGEYIASNRGIGWLVLYSGSSLDATGLFSAVVILVALTWLLTQVVSRSVAMMVPWLPTDDERNDPPTA